MAKKKTIIPPKTWSNPALSPGIRTGDFLFVSGQIAMDPSGQIVGVNNCEVQTRQVMTNLQAVVEAAGGTMDNVIKITCFLTNVEDYPAYCKVRGEVFPEIPPASSSVIVSGLVKPQALVEVEAIVDLSGVA